LLGHGSTGLGAASGLGSRQVDGRGLNIGPHVRLPVTDEPAHPNEGNTGACDSVFLRRRTCAAGNSLYITIGQQWIEHWYLLAMRRSGAPQEIVPSECPKQLPRNYPETIISGKQSIRGLVVVCLLSTADDQCGCCSQSSSESAVILPRTISRSLPQHPSLGIA
jgi:hypothetical protein